MVADYNGETREWLLLYHRISMSALILSEMLPMQVAGFSLPLFHAFHRDATFYWCFLFSRFLNRLILRDDVHGIYFLGDSVFLLVARCGDRQFFLLITVRFGVLLAFMNHVDVKETSSSS